METSCLGTIPDFLVTPDNFTYVLWHVYGSNQKAESSAGHQSQLENHGGAGWMLDGCGFGAWAWGRRRTGLCISVKRAELSAFCGSFTSTACQSGAGVLEPRDQKSDRVKLFPSLWLIFHSFSPPNTSPPCTTLYQRPTRG